jgi:hypothetical protein
LSADTRPARHQPDLDPRPGESNRHTTGPADTSDQHQRRGVLGYPSSQIVRLQNDENTRRTRGLPFVAESLAGVGGREIDSRRIEFRTLYSSLYVCPRRRDRAPRPQLANSGWQEKDEARRNPRRPRAADEGSGLVVLGSAENQVHVGRKCIPWGTVWTTVPCSPCPGALARRQRARVR